MGGSKPNLADLAAFGVLNAIEGCEAFQVNPSWIKYCKGRYKGKILKPNKDLQPGPKVLPGPPSPHDTG